MELRILVTLNGLYISSFGWQIRQHRMYLTFSDITVAETVPVLAATNPTTPLGFSSITSVDTQPTTTSKPIAPFDFSGITSIETSPVAPIVWHPNGLHYCIFGRQIRKYYI